jgi:hypothetical protein
MLDAVSKPNGITDAGRFPRVTANQLQKAPWESTDSQLCMDYAVSYRAGNAHGAFKVIDFSVVPSPSIIGQNRNRDKARRIRS